MAAFVTHAVMAPVLGSAKASFAGKSVQVQRSAGATRRPRSCSGVSGMSMILDINNIKTREKLLREMEIEPETFIYTSSDWLANLKSLPFSEVLFRIRSHLTWNAALASIVTILYHVHSFATFSATTHELLGTALGLLLVFRTDAAYARFWEGLDLCSKLVQTCRALCRNAFMYVRNTDDAIEIQRLVVIFAYSLRDHVTRRVSLEPFDELLTTDELLVFQTEPYNRPIMTLVWLSNAILHSYERPKANSIEMFSLEQMVRDLESIVSKMERLIRMPVPRAYAKHTSRFLSLYCFSLPFVIVRDFDWLTIPAAVWVCWALFSIEELGSVIENPFELRTRSSGKRQAMIDMHDFSETIRRDTCAIRMSSSRIKRQEKVNVAAKEFGVVVCKDCKD